MNGETYQVGDEVKVYLVAGVFRGIIENAKNVAIEIDDLHYATAMLYLVRLIIGDKLIFVSDPFMSKVKKADHV